jgi:hypothetical protein
MFLFVSFEAQDASRLAVSAQPSTCYITGLVIRPFSAQSSTYGTRQYFLLLQSKRFERCCKYYLLPFAEAMKVLSV